MKEHPANELSKDIRRFIEQNKGKIVLVDDDVHFLELASSTLKDNGYEVAEALDGEQAIRLIEEYKPDMVYIDWKMPKRTGLDVINHFKKVGHAFPIVVMT